MSKSLCFTLIVMLHILFSCSRKEDVKQDKLTFDDCSIVAERIDLNGKELIDLDLLSIKDTFNIPLNLLLSSFDIIRLENKEEAITAAGQDTYIAVSDNYIMINSFKAGSSNKLYDRHGKYLRTLSSSGQGPDEYNLGLYDMWLDEKNHKAYLMGIRASKLLVFDLDGKPSKHIPLAYTTHKGRFTINPEDQSLTMMCLPFRDTPTALVWEQDFTGNVIQEYPVSEQFMILPSTYDNEIRESLNAGAMDLYLHNCVAAQDSLYHYDTATNSLTPIFTMHTKNESICHFYTELPNHYLVTWYTQTSWNNELPRFPKILVDKETLRGCFVNLKFNMLGNIDGPSNLSFSRGYLTAIMEPYALKEQLEKALSLPNNLSPAMRKKVKDLNDSITDDDNCIVFIGKLKK